MLIEIPTNTQHCKKTHFAGEKDWSIRSLDCEPTPVNLPARSVRSNGSLIRQLRLNRGWTQLELAKLAGYSARLIRKVESSSFVDIETVRNIAEAMSTAIEPVAYLQLTLDNLSVATKWIEDGYETLGGALTKGLAERAIESQMDAVRTCACLQFRVESFLGVLLVVRQANCILCINDF